MAEHNYTDTAIGIGAGYAVKKYSEQILKKPYSIYLKDYRKKFFNDAENQIFKQKGFETFTKLGLDKQGITLIDINPANCDAEFAKLKFKGKLSDYKKAADGKQAFFHPAAESIAVNCDKRASSIFHEIGHVHNYTAADWKNKLYKVRMFSKPAAFLALTAGLCTNKDSFFNENCGKLTFAALTPIIAEEALASKNGQNMAKSVLPANLFKKLKAINARSLGSYIFGAIATSIAAAFAVDVKNRIAQPA
ncbi:TPA: hypothetical protein CPT91_06195 [Candidatus Gastranaerophilales bacterium HUM_16]|nr:MAG TPA: hypothetical protein CPT91_06195 [Candidatus Gastranaerophilales bacterium HUM_16]